ncbi:MAG: thiamine pyrophosphate-dependent enzyme [Nitrososphaerota archaeon]
MLKLQKFRSFSESNLGLDEAVKIEELYYQRITPDGTLIGEKPDIPKELLLQMYYLMLFGREFDEQASRLSTFREIGTYAPHMGQEAAQTGIVLAQRQDDWYVPMYRDNLGMIIKGLPAESILQYWSGDERGMSIPQGVNMVPLAVPVGTQVPQASGIAMALKIKKQKAAVLVTTGDGGTSKGDFHEGLNMAGTFKLPVVFAVENNQYAISLPRAKQTASKTLAQKAVAYGFEGILVDGNDVIATYEAAKYAHEKAREGNGPTLIELYTYRRSVHTTAELVSHKLQPQEELKEWEAKDPITRMERYLLQEGIIDNTEIEKTRSRAKSEMNKAVQSFRSIASPNPMDIFMYAYDSLTPNLLDQMQEAIGNVAVEKLYTPVQEELLQGGRPGVNIRNAINMALRQEMQRDHNIVLFGEDVGKNGGVFQVTRGLQDEFGVERVFDTPLSELGIAAMFFGLSLAGLIPVAEFQFEGFTPPAFDQIFSHIARIRNRSRGKYHARGVIRFPYGAGINAPEHHLDSPETYFCHTPGLKVVVPSTPYDAKGLLASALEEPNPVIYMEPKKLYDSPRTNVPEERYRIPIGKAKVVIEGNDVSIISYGSMMVQALESAEYLRSQGICSPEVIDLRTLSPLDYDTIVNSVKKTGRLVIVHEAPRTLGLGSEIAALAADKVLEYLKAPIKRVTGYDITTPLSKLGEYNVPSQERIVSAVRKVLEY